MANEQPMLGFVVTLGWRIKQAFFRSHETQETQETHLRSFRPACPNPLIVPRVIGSRTKNPVGVASLSNAKNVSIDCFSAARLRGAQARLAAVPLKNKLICGVLAFYKDATPPGF